MSKSLLEYIRKNTLFAGEKGKSVSWRCNINQLYNNWSKVAGLESQLKSRDSINQYKCSIGVLKNAGLMINKSNQILDSFRNPEETIRVITTLAHSINGDGSPSIDILNSKDNTTLRSLKTLLNIDTISYQNNISKCESLVYYIILSLFITNTKDDFEATNKFFTKILEKTEKFLNTCLENFGNKKKCNEALRKLFKSYKKYDIYEVFINLLGHNKKYYINKKTDKIELFKNAKEKSNVLKNLKSLFININYKFCVDGCCDYWINYFYININSKNKKKAFIALKGAQEFIDRSKFLKMDLANIYNYENLLARIRDKISTCKNDEYNNIEDILTSNILNKYGIQTCIRPRYNQLQMWDTIHESLKTNKKTCIINSSTMGSGKSVGSMLIPHIINKIYNGKFAYIYTSYGEHLLGQQCDILNFRENRGLMTPGSLVLHNGTDPEFYFWYEGCNLPSVRDLKRISSGSVKANKNGVRKRIDHALNGKKKNVSKSRNIHKPFVYVSDIASIPQLIKQLKDDDYKTILVVDEPPLSASKYLINRKDSTMNELMNCLTCDTDILVMMCATQPELKHMPKLNRYLKWRFDKIIDVTENKIAQSTKMMCNNELILPHYLNVSDAYYDTIKSPLNYRFYSLNSSVKCFNDKKYNISDHLQSDIISISDFQTKIQNLKFTKDDLKEITKIETNLSSLINQIIINKPFKTGNQILWIENIDINNFNSNTGDEIFKICQELINIIELSFKKYGGNIPKHMLIKNKYTTYLRYLKQEKGQILDNLYSKLKKASWRIPIESMFKYILVDSNITDKMFILFLNGIGMHYLGNNTYYKCIKYLRDNNLLAMYIAPIEYAFGTNMVLSAVVIDPKVANNLSPDVIRQLTGRVSRGLTKNPGLIMTDKITMNKFLFERSPEAEMMDKFMPPQELWQKL